MAGWRAPRFWIPFKILHNNSELHVLLTCVCQSPYFPTFFVICRQASRKTAQFISNVTFKSWARARKRNFSNWKLIVLAIWVSCCAWRPPKWPQSQQQTGTLMSLSNPSIHYCNYIALVCSPQYSLGAHKNPHPLIWIFPVEFPNGTLSCKQSFARERGDVLTWTNYVFSSCRFF